MSDSEKRELQVLSLSICDLTSLNPFFDADIMSYSTPHCS